jgi:hypothetical protein
VCQALVLFGKERNEMKGERKKKRRDDDRERDL